MFLKKSIFSLFLLFTLSILTFFLLFSYLTIILRANEEFKADVEAYRQSYYTTQKELIKSEVTKAVEYAEYMKPHFEKHSRERLRFHVDEASDIIDYFMNDAGEPFDAEAFALTLFSGWSWAKKDGYIFVLRTDGTLLVDAAAKDLEGTNVLLVQDDKGAFVFQNIIALAQAKKEGFITYSWPKPGHPGTSFPKFTYVRLVESLGWIIGTGDYLDGAKKEMQNMVAERLASIRFGRDGYIFVTDYNGVELVNGTQPDLVGTNMWDLTDENGVKVVQELKKACQKPEGGFVEYVWNKPSSGKSVKKISYVLGIDDWQWCVGAGLYVDELDKIIAQKREKLEKNIAENSYNSLLIFAAMLLLSVLATLIFSRKLQKQFKFFMAFFKNSAFSNEPIDEKQLSIDEFHEMAVSVNHMVRERERSQKAIVDSEIRFRGLIEQSPRSVQIFDADGYMLKANAAFERIFGMNEKSMLESDYNVLTNKRPYDEETLEVVKLGFKGEYLFLPEMSVSRIVDGKNKTIWLRGSVFPVMGADGNILEVILLHEDMTEWRNMDHARKQALHWHQGMNKMFDSIFSFDGLSSWCQTITQSIVDTFDADFCRLWVLNKGDACESWCVHSKKSTGMEVCGNRDACLHLVASSGRYAQTTGTHARVPLESCKIGRLASGRESRFLTNDVSNDPGVKNPQWADELGLVSFAGYQLRDESGKPNGVLALFAKHPITQEEADVLQLVANSAAQVVQLGLASDELMHETEARKKAQEHLQKLNVELEQRVEQRTLELRTANEELRAYNKLREDVERITHHDLKSPLSTIIGVPQLMQDGTLSSKQARQLKRVEEAGYRMLHMINMSLDIYKMETGTYKLNVADVDLVPLVSSITQDLHSFSTAYGVEFLVELDQGPLQSTHSFVVAGEELLYYSLLSNLFKNAVEASPSGSKVRVLLENGDPRHIRIHNAGVIPEDIRGTFFEKYASSGKDKGSGLGTYSAKLITETLGGGISFTSTHENGTTVSISLPE